MCIRDRVRAGQHLPLADAVGAGLVAFDFSHTAGFVAPCAVSYTHLPWIFSGTLLNALVLYALFAAPVLDEAALMVYFSVVYIPVSYTHLDVYKRQPLNLHHQLQFPDCC